VVSPNFRDLLSGSDDRGVHIFRPRAAEIDLDESWSHGICYRRWWTVKSRASNALGTPRVERKCLGTFETGFRMGAPLRAGARGTGVGEGDVYEVDGILDLRSLRELTDSPISGGRSSARWPGILRTGTQTSWERLGNGDVLGMHRTRISGRARAVLRRASDDPLVALDTATLYRVADRSPIVDAFSRARTAGKEVILYRGAEGALRLSAEHRLGARLEDAGATVRLWRSSALKNHASWVGSCAGGKRFAGGATYTSAAGTTTAHRPAYTALCLFYAVPISARC